MAVFEDQLTPYYDKHVSIVDLYAVDEAPDGKVTFGKTRFKATVCEGEMLKAFTNIYEIKQNEEVVKPAIDAIRELSAKPYIDMVNSYVNNRSMRLSIILRDISVVEDSHSPTYLTAIIGNSYDGTMAATVEYGYYRLICSNGAMVFENLLPKIYSKHTCGFDTEEIYQHSQKVIQMVPELTKRFQLMQRLEFGENRELKKKIINLMPQKFQDTGEWQSVTDKTSIYDVYQVLTWYATHYIAMSGRYAAFKSISKLFGV